MTALTFPSGINPKTVTLQYVANERVVESPLTGARQVSARVGSRLRVNMSFPPLSGTDRNTLFAFLMRLEGRKNTVRLSVPTLLRTAAASVGTGLVNGAHNAGATSIATDGWNISTRVFNAGDPVQFGNQLTVITQDADSDATGAATLSISPSLHKTVADNATVVYTNPTGDFFLESMPSFPSSPKAAQDFFSPVTITLIQDVLA